VLERKQGKDIKKVVINDHFIRFISTASTCQFVIFQLINYSRLCEWYSVHFY
jgi:hypothetical protein